ncbi:MAG: response regulator, partial [Maribacter sp.]|nr:response regulator [Maribacter sp.]
MENKVRILVVEDDMIIAAHISLQLTNLGYEITGIETRGEEAVEHANINTPDIILMDVNLRGALDGIETAKMIQQKRNVPIIYLTANT